MTTNIMAVHRDFEKIVKQIRQNTKDKYNYDITQIDITKQIADELKNCDVPFQINIITNWKRRKQVFTIDIKEMKI